MELACACGTLCVDAPKFFSKRIRQINRDGAASARPSAHEEAQKNFPELEQSIALQQFPHGDAVLTSSMVQEVRWREHCVYFAILAIQFQCKMLLDVICRRI